MPGLKSHGGAPRIIVIEQNPVLRNSIRMILEERYPLTLFDRELEALLVPDEASIGLLIYGTLSPLDRQVEFLRTLGTRPNRPEVILLTDDSNIDDVESYRGSLFTEVLPRTFSPMLLLHVVEEILERRAHRIDKAGPWVAGKLIEHYRLELESRIIASEVREGIQHALATDVPVTICGEPGTDHETLARIIHYLSRASTVFVKFGCRRTQADLFFSRLSKAVHTRPGTLYLEEVEYLAEDLVDPISTLLTQGLLVDGRGREVSAAPRLIVSTTRDLGSLVGRGVFPEGLFQRLSVLTISIPPLRTRVEDLADLAAEITKAQTRKLKLMPKRFGTDAIERLQSYSWPGNLEELRSVISRTLLLCSGETVHADQIAFGFNRPATEPVEKSKPVPESAVEESTEANPALEMINDRSLGMILTDIVHQVRNPLVSVRTFLQLLEDKFDDPAFRRDFARVVGGDLTRINEVMERLLTFTQISRPEPRAVDLNGLIREVLNQYDERFEEKGISVRSRFGEGLEEVLVDPEHLRYILSSLFNDAWKSSYPEGETVVTSALVREAGESPSPDWTRFPSIAIEISFPWYPESGNSESQDVHFFIPVDGEEESESRPWSLELILCDRLIQMQEGTILVKTPKRGMRSVALLLPAGRTDPRTEPPPQEDPGTLLRRDDAVYNGGMTVPPGQRRMHPETSKSRDKTVERVLVIRFGAIGDCLRTLPAVRRLRLAKPHAEIAWAVENWVFPVLEGNPNIDHFHILDRRVLNSGAGRAAGEMRRFHAEIRAHEYDIVLDFHGRFKSGLASMLSGAPKRIGFARGDSTEGNHLFNNIRVRLADRWENRVLRFLHLLEPLDIDMSYDAGDTGIVVPRGELVAANHWFEANGRPPLAVYPGTSRKRMKERWPLGKWKELLARFSEAGIASVLFWGPDEEELAGELAEAAGSPCMLAPATSLPRMQAMLSCFRAFLGSDTAAMHMAWLQGVPTAVFTGLKPERTFSPLDPVPHRVLRARQYERPDLPLHKQPPEVLTQVSVDEAYEAVRELLEGPVKA